jgi:hypothetical protein
MICLFSHGDLGWITEATILTKPDGEAEAEDLQGLLTPPGSQKGLTLDTQTLRIPLLIFW